LTLLSYGYAQQRTGEEVSGKPMMLYFHFDRVLVDSSYMDNSRTFRHMDQLFTILSIMPHTIETDTLTFLQSGKTIVSAKKSGSGFLPPTSLAGTENQSFV